MGLWVYGYVVYGCMGVWLMDVRDYKVWRYGDIYGVYKSDVTATSE